MRRAFSLALLGTLAIGGCAVSTGTPPLPEQVAAGAYQGEANPTHQIVSEPAAAGVPIDDVQLQTGERLVIIHAGRYPNGAYRINVTADRAESEVTLSCTVERLDDRGVAFTQAIITPWQVYRIPSDIDRISVADCADYTAE